MPDFQEFWRFLGDLAESAARCNCREGTCGPPFCVIRKCAPGKGVEVCPLCADYPSYCDIRCHPYDIPAKVGWRPGH